jgi:glycosyltransferase involved in cell wall biosynthesis
VQIAKPGEVIVVDDTPNTEINDLCEKYAAKFGRTRVSLIYVRNCRERSISIARNLGGKMARGDILMFVDSDVTLYPEYIEKVSATFREYPRALGVQGWERALIDSHAAGVRYQTMEIFKKLFLLWHSSRNSCNNFEYPIELSNTTYSKYLNGRCSSVKHSVFNEFQFDENLKGYSWMEDFLFTASINKKYPKSLLITPQAMHKHSSNAESALARPKGKNLVNMKRRNRKYVLMQLWGSKGLLMFGWQNLGILIFKSIAESRRKIHRMGNFGLTGGEE